MTNCVYPLIFAHRGASADYPENTTEAFTGAATQGADWVELDVRVTKDGVPIINHDPWYHDLRMVAEYPSSSRPESVPTLAEALDVCARSGPSPMGVNVEIKGPVAGLEPNPDGHREELVDRSLEVIEAVCSALAAEGREPEIVVSSFDADVLARVRAANGPPTALLVKSRFPNSGIGDLVEAGHVALNPHETHVTAELVEAVHSAGLAVNVWTVDDSARLVELAELGVDAVITNVPGRARSAIETPRGGEGGSRKNAPI